MRPSEPKRDGKVTRPENRTGESLCLIQPACGPALVSSTRGWRTRGLFSLRAAVSAVVAAAPPTVPLSCLHRPNEHRPLAPCLQSSHNTRSSTARSTTWLELLQLFPFYRRTFPADPSLLLSCPPGVGPLSPRLLPPILGESPDDAFITPLSLSTDPNVLHREPELRWKTQVLHVNNSLPLPD